MTYDTLKYIKTNMFIQIVKVFYLLQSSKSGKMHSNIHVSLKFQDSCFTDNERYVKVYEKTKKNANF